MRLRIALIFGLVAAVAVGAMSLGQAAQPFSMANGGGQIIAGNESGAGDTIAFTVRDEDAPTGQIQYVERSDNSGQPQVVRHGQPTCFTAEGKVATIGVKWQDNTTATIFVTDNGATADDAVTVVPGTPNCDDDGPDDETHLGRGNVTVWDVQ